jgi:two-component system NtrC family response regulator
METVNEHKLPEGLSILFADDEESLQELMRLELPRMGHRVTVCADGMTAVNVLAEQSFDCLLVDLDMPGISGIDVIEQARDICPDIDVVILTGKSSLESAIAAVRFGVFEYLTKPSKLSDLKTLLTKIATKRQLEKKYHALKRQLSRVEGDPELIGDEPRMLQVKQLVKRVAPTNSTVLVRGETGTGKELVARAIHQQSLRAEMPFVVVNCGALPENLIESELFGHRKGAFTGADENHRGLFEVAGGGSLLLDEIGELPRAMQAQLLRVLESGEIRRVGDNQVFQVDVRIICATHRDLVAMAEAGDFREDLMFRINTFEIPLPALREHVEDIPHIAEHLYMRLSQDATPPARIFSDETLELLQAHHWPGNVRELVNAVEYAMILCDQLPIQPEHMPKRFLEPGHNRHPYPSAGKTLKQLEMEAIHAALVRHDKNKPAVAEELGISLKTLYNKLNNHAGEDRKAS